MQGAKSLLPASHSLVVPGAGRGCLCCASGRPSLKIWPASSTARSEDQAQTSAPALASLLYRVGAFLSSPRLPAHALPDSRRHWLLPVANPRDWRRHAPPQLPLAQLVPVDVLCRLARGSSPAPAAESGRQRCRRRPQGGSTALRLHPSLAAPALH